MAEKACVWHTPEDFEESFRPHRKKRRWLLAMVPCIWNILWYIRDILNFRSWQTAYGNVIHLGERDCSIQRNHQKMIEESPSAAFHRKLREKMGDAAVKAAKAAGYVNAGTIEFLLEQDGMPFTLWR